MFANASDALSRLVSDHAGLSFCPSRPLPNTSVMRSQRSDPFVCSCLFLVLCSALSLDGRNFHAWNYRQFVVKLMGVHTEEELGYSSSLIAADFSNYSAWHYRTMLLPRLYNEDIKTGQ